MKLKGVVAGTASVMLLGVSAGYGIASSQSARDDRPAGGNATEHAPGTSGMHRQMPSTDGQMTRDPQMREMHARMMRDPDMRRLHGRMMRDPDMRRLHGRMMRDSQTGSMHHKSTGHAGAGPMHGHTD